jgi:uncharacterized protein YndB with AHSA1/START domain
VAHELVFRLPALPERVWDALTNPAKLSAWFGVTDLVPEPGRRFTITPRAVTGLDGPITGEVLAVDEHRLVMLWRTGAGELVMTWLVEAGRGGSVLTVTQSGGLGSGGPEQTYEALFDEHLRGFLRTGMLSRIQPPPRPSQDPLAELGLDPEPDSSPVALFKALSKPKQPRERRRPRGVFIAFLAGIVVALVVIAWAATSSGTLPSWGAPGQQGQPLANDTHSDQPSPSESGTRAGNPVGPGATDTPAAAPSAGPEGAATAAPTTTAAAAPMTVGTSVNDSLLTFTVTVTVRNPAGAAQRWRNARVTLAILDLGVSNVDNPVSWTKHGSIVCFTPSPAVADVGPGAMFSFRFTVTKAASGLLGDVDGAALDDPDC